MIEYHDLGLLSQYELYTRAEPDSPFEMGADPARNPLPQLLAAAKPALPHLDKALAPGRAKDPWSYDNIREILPVGRSCLDENAPAGPRFTRQRPLP